MQVGNILMIIAMTIFVVALIIGSKTPNTWKWTGITWGILTIGLIIFATAMIIS